jgi:glycosyltransferase involved in cell wall biosynthesis
MANLSKILFGDLIVTYSDFSKNKLLSMGFNNVTTIHPGIDLNTYKPVDNARKALKELNIGSGDFVITYPGEYVRLGATDLLVDIIPELAKRIDNLKFIFACRIKNQADATKKSEVKNILESKGLMDKIIFTDTLKDMASLYNSSDVIVFPVSSMAGKFDVPLAVIESMACAKPVIVSNLAVLNEFTNNDNALVMKEVSSGELLNIIQRLYENPSVRESVSKSAIDYVSNNFSISSVAESYERLYRSSVI